MFSPRPEQLPAAAERLPDTATVFGQLVALGEAMGEGSSAEVNPATDVIGLGEAGIPAAYTYLGQFIDHDITNTVGAPQITNQPITPITNVNGLTNLRTARLDLDSVYGPLRPNAGEPSIVPPPIGAKMQVGKVSKVTQPGAQPVFQEIPGKGIFNDVPRRGRDTNPDLDREALIGDPRNDENLIVQQLHTAFLKAHNTLADITGSFASARKALTLIYQSVVIDDYLPRICDAATLADITANGPRFFPSRVQTFMPIEFAAAGYRFGHSMVRQNYDFNLNFSPADSRFLFTFTALSGNVTFQPVPIGTPNPSLVGTLTYPDNWIIQWERFVSINGSKPQRARPIDPKLAPILFELRDTFGRPIVDPGPGGQPSPLNISRNLAKRNLLRGYALALPTGQAVAQKIGTPAITISEATTGIADAVVGPFKTATPLWLYVLTEAKLNGGKLGVVGTRIVGETLVSLVMRSKPSIFDKAGKRVSDHRYKLADILNLAALQDPEGTFTAPAAGE